MARASRPMPHESTSFSGSEEGAPTRTPRASRLVGSITSSTWHAAGRGWGRWIHRAQARLFTCATVGPRAIFPDDGFVLPVSDVRCAHTDSRTRISKTFEVARRSRVTTRPTTPKPNSNRAGSARARSHAPVCTLWLAWVFVGSKGTILWIERGQKRGNRARGFDMLRLRIHHYMSRVEMGRLQGGGWSEMRAPAACRR